MARVKRKSKQSLEHLSMDIDVYDDVLKVSNKLADSVEEGNKVFEGFENLSKDMFLSLYKYSPKLKEDEEILSSSLINKSVMSELMGSDSYEDIKTNCKGDSFCSAMGMELLNESAIRIYKRIHSDIQDQMERQGISQEELKKYMDMERQYSDLQNEKDELSDETDKNNSNQDQIDKIDNQLNQLEKSMSSDKVSNLFKDLSLSQGAMSSAVSEASKKVSEAKKMMGQWGLGEAFNGRMPYEESKELLARLKDSKKLKAIAKVVGSMKDIALKSKKRKAKDGDTSIKSITTGNHIERVLPSEKVRLCNSITKKDFMRRYNQKELLEYKMESYKNKGRGPIIACLDMSGSMNGERALWAKSVALSLLEIARKQRREFAVIPYDSDVRGTFISPKNKFNPQIILDIGEQSTGGGTDFEEPLEESLKLINGSKFNKADIVFITDGDASVSSRFKDKFKKIKKRKEFQVISIKISNYQSRGLTEFSDRIVEINLDSDNNSDILKEVFSAI